MLSRSIPKDRVGPGNRTGARGGSTMGVEHDVPKAGTGGRVLQILQAAFAERRNRNWFDGRSARIDWRQNALTVYANSPILLGWLQKNFHELLCDTARTVGGDEAVVRYEVDAALKPTELTKLADPIATPVVRNVTRALAPQTPAPPRPRQPRPYDLNRFVRGASNELAATAVQTLIDFPDSCPNPMYLHGGVGCGKTHLLEGLRDGLSRRQPNLQILALTSEEFTNLFTQALDSRSLPASVRSSGMWISSSWMTSISSTASGSSRKNSCTPSSIC